MDKHARIRQTTYMDCKVDVIDPETTIPRYYIVSHTHWDREWYLPFEQFRYKLVKLFDNLLDLLDSDKEFVCFHMDGQTIVLDDYLEIRPENKDRLEKHIRDHRIVVGPWYVQNDLFLTSGESTVRNLNEGIARARRIYREMKIGYFPDHFGLIGQIPQILRLVGIDNAVIGRGYDASKRDNHHNFVWKAPDGTEITVIHFPFWYNNAQRLPVTKDDLMKTFSLISEDLQSVSPIPAYLLMNGVDHLEAQENLSEVIRMLRRQLGRYTEIDHAYLEDYVKHIESHMEDHPEAYPVAIGELREGADDSILAGTLSSRRYLKQANMACGDLLEKWLEPLCGYTDSIGLKPYDSDYFDYLWRIFMQNHPHDSICGCSQDAVHQEMMLRYRKIGQVGDAMLADTMDIISSQITCEGFESTDRKLVVFNTSQCEADQVICTKIQFLKEENIEDFCIFDENSEELPYHVVDCSPKRIQRNSPINLPQIFMVVEYLVEWKPCVPPMSYKCYRVAKGVSRKKVTCIEDSERVLENSVLKITFHNNGSFDLLEKQTGRLLKNQGKFEEQGDAGQLYVFIPVKEKKVHRSPVQFSKTIRNPFYSEIKYRFHWRLPKCLDDGFTSRSSESAASVFDVTVRLEENSNQAVISLKLDNQSCDHRIRILFNMDERIQYTCAGGQFDVIRREYSGNNGWNKKSNTQPYWKMVSSHAASGAGLLATSYGTCEYEVADDHTLALTLLRCVSSINYRDIPPLDSDMQPDGQCLGENCFELTVGPSTSFSPAGMYESAELHHQGLKTYILPINDTKWRQGRPWVQDSSIAAQYTRPTGNEQKPKLPLCGQFLQIDSKVVLSAFKKSKDGNGYIVRAFNPSDTDCMIPIDFPPGYSREETNLLEELISQSRVGENSMVLFKAKEIKTIRFYKKDEREDLAAPQN